jgi:hypothetical protein
LLVLIGSVSFWACQENEENVLGSLENNTVTPTASLAPISVVEAQNWYEANKQNTPNSFSREEQVINSATVTPDWNFASMIKFEGKKDVIVVPILDDIGMSSLPTTSVVNLIIFKDAYNQFRTRLLFFVPTEEYSASHRNYLSTKDFSGVTYQVDDSSRIRLGWAIENGKFVGALDIVGIFSNSQNYAVSRDFPDWISRIINWFRGLLCYDFSTSRMDRFRDYVKRFNRKMYLDFNKKPLKRKYDGTDGSNEGDYGAGSAFIELWGSWVDSDPDTQGGGTVGFKDFFPDGVFGIKNVKNSYDDVCNTSTTNANTPFLFAMDNLRQVAINDAQFENAFAQTLDYYYQLKAMGQNVTFAEVMKDYVINPSKGISAPTQLTPQLPTLASSPIFKSKVRSLMQQATSQYSQCVNTYGLQASTNNSPIEIPNNAACSCLGDFSVEDALNDMQSTINAVKIQDLKDRYPGYNDEIDWLTQKGFSPQSLDKELLDIAQRK